MFGDRSSERIIRHFEAMFHPFNLDAMDDDGDDMMFMSPAAAAQHAYQDQDEDDEYDSPHSHLANGRTQDTPWDHGTPNLPTERRTQIHI